MSNLELAKQIFIHAAEKEIYSNCPMDPDDIDNNVDTFDQTEIGRIASQAIRAADVFDRVANEIEAECAV